jgi:glutamine amidotransferase
MGWNQLELRGRPRPELVAMTAGDEKNDEVRAVPGDPPWAYFVHSYHAKADDPSLVSAVSSYGPNTITAAVSRDNVLATQFHPEKSQAGGIRLLAAFLRG